MSSHLNQGSETPELPENFVVSFEKKLLELQDHKDVEHLLAKLKYLGLNYDPFHHEVGQECSEIMDHLGLTTHLQNPYLATNILLRLLDVTEERLKNLKH